MFLRRRENLCGSPRRIFESTEQVASRVAPMDIDQRKFLRLSVARRLAHVHMICRIDAKAHHEAQDAHQEVPNSSQEVQAKEALSDC
mmetsp:Transcript_65181/g.105402  ORF Transcript_65181/g.105402 Transcript_65181/m.105402 type:complete len:87 (-) Transcript_65181:637-897(-)